MSSTRMPAAVLFGCAAAVLPAQQGEPPGGQQPMPVPTPPPAQSQNPWSSPHRASVRLDLALGGGRIEHDTETSLLDGDTSAGYFRLGLEFIGEQQFGGGFRLEGIGSKDDLFADTGLGSAQAADGELFLHGTGVFGSDRVRFPVRFGVFLRDYQLEDSATGDTIDWYTVGPRIEVEPDVALTMTDNLRWSVYGRLGAGLGFTWVETDPSTDTFDTNMVSLDLGLGTRLALSQVRFDVGFLLRSSHYDESDPSGGVVIRQVDSDFTGVVFGIAVAF